MPTPTTWPSAKQFIGTAKETTQGTAVVPITFTHPVDSFEPSDEYVWLDDKALRGSMVEEYGLIQGPGHTEWSLAGPAFLDGIGFWLNNILGDLVTTGASAPFSHVFSTLNSGTGQPGSLTVVDWQGTPTNQGRQYPGVCVAELTLKGNPESTLLEWSAKGSGWLSAISAAAPVSAPTAAAPLAAWRTKIGIGGPASGGTLISTAREWEVTISREIRVQHTAQNTQQPYIIQRGKLSAAGSITFTKPSDEAPFNYMNSNTQPQVQILISNGGAGAALLSAQIDMQVCAFNSAKINRGEEAVGYDDGFVAIANTTNAGASGGYSPIKITLQNAIASGTY
jgi:hypothetical protein